MNPLPNLPQKHVFEWDETDVHEYLCTLGYNGFEERIKEDRITGDIFVLLDNTTLKDYGFSIGQRLSILKSIYQLKLSYGVEIEDGDWVPPSEANDSVNGHSGSSYNGSASHRLGTGTGTDSWISAGTDSSEGWGHDQMTLERLTEIVRDQSNRLHSLESQNAHLSSLLHSVMDDFTVLRSSLVSSTSQLPVPVTALERSHSDEALPAISQTSNASAAASSILNNNNNGTAMGPGRLNRAPSFKWDPSVPRGGGKGQISPTKSNILDLGTPQGSPTFPAGASSTVDNGNGNAGTPRKGARPTGIVGSTGPDASRPGLAGRTESSDNLKSFKVSLEDPTWKVLPAALKKYRINNDNWQNYAMFICYGSSGNRIERCLSYDEKPLLLFQKLKDAKKNPVFMLKHIKDIRSPIVVAQQKHAARKASSIASAGTEPSSGAMAGAPGGSITPGQAAAGAGAVAKRAHRPPRLEVQDLSQTPPNPSSAVDPNAPSTALLTGINLSTAGLSSGSLGPMSALGTSVVSAVGGAGGGGWPAHELSSPSPNTSVGADGSGSGGVGSGTGTGTTREMPPLNLSNGVSYAVAIYPYMAEQEDEFDVVVGDTFIILSRARGWWVVQRDPTGSGMVDTDVAKQGWVPAGCLLETNVPVASAIAEAEAAKSATLPKPSIPNSVNATPEIGMEEGPGDAADEGVSRDVLGDGGENEGDGGKGKSKTPILPLSIISTSFPGVALMEYRKKGEEELDLEKDDKLRVFKRYNHWSYAVKEDGGDRGWVPSWFIGKVAPQPGSESKSGANNSNGTTNSPANAAVPGEEGQVSPLSSAFPVSGSSTTRI